MIYDDDIEVKAAAVKLFTNIIEYFPEEVQNKQLKYIFLDYLKCPRIEVQLTVSDSFGKIFNLLKHTIIEEFNPENE